MEIEREFTIVVNRKIKPGCEKEYDDWLRRYLILERKIPGYVETTIITEGGTNSAVRHIIHRFADKASLDAWENSEEANKYSTRYYERATGLETWFNLATLAQGSHLSTNIISRHITRHTSTSGVASETRSIGSLLTV